MESSRLQLDPAMQAIDVFLDIDGQPIRVIVPREVLEEKLRSGTDHEGWFNACREHMSSLRAIAQRRLAAKPQDFVVVRSTDFAPANK